MESSKKDAEIPALREKLLGNEVARQEHAQSEPATQKTGKSSSLPIKSHPLRATTEDPTASSSWHRACMGSKLLRGSSEEVFAFER